MLIRNRRKIGISLLLFAAAAMLFRLTYARVQSQISIWLMGVAILLVLAALTLFALYFEEWDKKTN